ncbi:hypothetical protein LUZ60_013871 [Juncus effusus]|nr:hypothetical protein LUZ60_013871 [Juncus effusus]
MQSALRSLLHLRRLYRRRLLSPNITQTVNFPFNPTLLRSSFASSNRFSSPLASFKETNESNDEDEINREHDVTTYFDPIQGTIVTKEPEFDKFVGSFSSIGEFPTQAKRNGSEREEEREGEQTGRKIWEKRHKSRNNRAETPQKTNSWSNSVIRKPKGAKTRVSYVCDSCGANFSQWWGTCRSCGTIGSIKSFTESGPELSEVKRGAELSEAVVRSWLPQKAGTLVPKSLTEINKGRDQSEWRIPLSGLFGMEVSRVVGGGVVPGSLILIGGDPGVGKSTLLLQIAAIMAEGFNTSGSAPVVYVSGEESIEQIGNRADRMRIATENLFLYSSTDIEDIFDKIQPFNPRALIIDSIQTVYLKGIAGSAGNVMQVKECTSALLRFAKQTNIPVLLIGHVTKTGDIAGPRILEHIVDVVLYMEGERYSAYRLLRSVKNRFGSTDELGVFEMSETGLQAVSNPSEMFLTEQNPDSEILAGLAIGVMIDGSRTFVIEVQALCVAGTSNMRRVNGIDPSRADLIISVLMKQACLKLHDNAIFLNVVSGIKLSETAGDLAIAAAICSSFLESPIPNDVAFIGEIGLGGELRTVPRMDKRIIAVAKLGYKRCVVPKMSEKMIGGLDLDIEILVCKNLKEMIGIIFSPPDDFDL